MLFTMIFSHNESISNDTGCYTFFFTFSYLSKENAAQYAYTAVSRKVVGKNVHATIPKGNMGYDQYAVSDTAAFEPTFVAFF